MLLSGLEIEKHLGDEISINPFDRRNLGPNSYNLTLNRDLLVYTEDILDMKKDNSYRRFTIPEEGFVLHPNRLYLGRTNEYTMTKGFVPMLEGRSSIGRLGLFVHVTAGFGDVGFEGFWTLEIHCIEPIRIYADVPICQIYYHTLLGEYEPYSSKKYHRNSDVQTSRLYMDFNEEDISND